MPWLDTCFLPPFAEHMSVEGLLCAEHHAGGQGCSWEQDSPCPDGAPPRVRGDRRRRKQRKNPMLWSKFHTISLVLASQGRGVHSCTCVPMCVSVMCQFLRHTGRLRTQTRDGMSRVGIRILPPTGV